MAIRVLRQGDSSPLASLHFWEMLLVGLSTFGWKEDFERPDCRESECGYFSLAVCC